MTLREIAAQTLDRHRRFWSNRWLVTLTAQSAVFLGISFLFNRFASAFATNHASNAVHDLLLDNLPVFNVDFIVNEGAILFGLFIIFIVLLSPKRLPFVVKSLALFIFIRSFFIMFTHLGPFPEHSFLEPNELITSLTFGGDYFFSGHTGMPYLLALIFWREYRVRLICLLTSVFFGVSVILGHLHYSIDVFAAFFITYSIYVLATKFFSQELELFKEANGVEEILGQEIA